MVWFLGTLLALILVALIVLATIRSRHRARMDSIYIDYLVARISIPTVNPVQEDTARRLGYEQFRARLAENFQR